MFFDAHTHWDCDLYEADEPGVGRWLAAWDGHDVTHGVVMPARGLFDDRSIAKDNDAVAGACACQPGRMIPFCSVNPGLGAEAVAEFRRCLESLNVQGLKLHPWVQGVSPSIREVDDLCEVAGSYGVPVLFHDGTPCFSLPSQMALLARRHPGTTIILGHCGLFQHWREAIAAMRHAENLWGCLCGPYLTALGELIAQCDGDRLLWGSDHGFGEVDHVGYRKGLFETLKVKDSLREAIVDHNPARLFERALRRTTGVTSAVSLR